MPSVSSLYSLFLPIVAVEAGRRTPSPGAEQKDPPAAAPAETVTVGEEAESSISRPWNSRQRKGRELPDNAAIPVPRSLEGGADTGAKLRVVMEVVFNDAAAAGNGPAFPGRIPLRHGAEFSKLPVTLSP